MSLDRLIKKCIKAKQGNKDFALMFADGEWIAMIGNEDGGSLYLGEATPEVQVTGETAVDAVSSLLPLVEEWRPGPTNEVRAMEFLDRYGLKDIEF